MAASSVLARNERRKSGSKNTTLQLRFEELRDVCQFRRIGLLGLIPSDRIVRERLDVQRLQDLRKLSNPLSSRKRFL